MMELVYEGGGSEERWTVRERWKAQGAMDDEGRGGLDE